MDFLVKFYLSFFLPLANFQAYSSDLFLEKSPGIYPPHKKKKHTKKTKKTHLETFQNALDQSNVSETAAKTTLSPVTRCSFENFCVASCYRK